MTSSDGSFCLPVRVFLCFTCVFIGSSVSHISLGRVEQLIGDSVSQSFILIYLFLCLYFWTVFVCMCVCMCVGTVLQLAFLYHALSLSGLVTSKPRSGVYSCERHRCFTYVFITKIIHQSFHKPRQLSLHVPRCVSSPLHVTVMLYRDVAQQTCTMLHIKVQQMFFKHETIFVSKMLFYLTIFLPSKVSAIPRTC